MRATIFGESHGAAIGVVLEGVPAGLLLDWEKIHKEMKRRSARDNLSTPRREPDELEPQSGIFEGRTTGAPLCVIIRNREARSSDYEGLPPRPGHADYSALLRYRGFNDPRGGGHFSGRLTAPLVFAGAVAKQILASKGVIIGGQLQSVGSVETERFDALALSGEFLAAIAELDFPVANRDDAARMKQEILRAKAELDSIGGMVEVAAIGLPPGIGEPGRASLESLIASEIFAVPGVKGVEFGAGFACSVMRGSEANDEMTMRDGEITFLSNNNGGISGGISTGAPLICRVAMRPTPSIGQEQRSVDLASGQEKSFICRGRHDPCIAPRALPAIESALALALLTAFEKIGGELYVGE